MGLFSIASIIRVDRVDHDGIIVPGSYLLSGIRVVCSVVLFVMYVYLLLKAPVVARRAQTALAVYATEPTDCLASPSDCHPAEETKIGKDEPREEDPDISRSRLFCGKNPRSCVLLRYAALVMQSEIWQIQISIINGTRDYIVDSIMVFANLIAGSFSRFFRLC